MLQCVHSITAGSQVRTSPMERVPISAVPRALLQKEVCSVLSKKRDTNAATDSSLVPYMTSKKREFLLKGVNSFERLLFMFTASADGVSIWRRSRINNSVYVFSLFNENIPRRRVMRDLDAYFVFLVRCNSSAPESRETPQTPAVTPSSVTQDNQEDYIPEEDSVAIADNPQQDAEEKRGTASIYRGNMKGIGKGMTVGNSNIRLRVKFSPAMGKKSPADSDFREILHLVLGYMKEFGKRGFCIRAGSTLYSIQYAITSFRCDIPAQDMLVDSSGKHTSNSPCLTCNARMRVFDKYYMGVLPCVQASMVKNRDKMRTLNSSALVLNPKDPLRLLPAFLLGKNMSAVKERMRANLKDDDQTYSFLEKLRSLIPTNAKVYQLPEMECCSFYGIDNPLVSTNSVDTIGRVEIEKTTYLTKECCTSADIMHLTHNVADRILEYLFVPNSSNTPMEDEAMLYSQSTMNQGPVTNLDLASIDERIRGNAVKRLEIIKESLPPDLSSWVPLLIGEGKYAKPTANQKMRFCFAYLPYLLIDSLHDCTVWCFVQFFSVLSTMYNFDGSFEEMERLQGVMNTTLYVMENQVPPSFFTLCFHQCHHLYKYYGINGPLKSVDCYHGEEQYLGLADESVGGNNPELTIYKRKLIQTLSHICAKDASFLGVGMSVWDNQTVRDTYDDVNLMRRGYLNWIADNYRFIADSFPHVSFTDVELCGGVNSYLNTGCISFDPGFTSLVSTDSWVTSNEDLDGYWRKHYPSVKQHFTFAKKWDQLSWNKQRLDCFRGGPDCLNNASDFPQTGLAVAYSLDHKVHLFAVLCYISFHVSEEEAHSHVSEEEVHFQAQVYELPIHRLLPLNDCPFSFYLKVSEVKAITPSYTLISLHRLHMEDVVCFPIDNDTVYVGLNTICVRQWQIIHRVCYSLKRNGKGDLIIPM